MATTKFNFNELDVVKHVTRPLLKLEPGVDYLVTIESAFRQAEQMKNPKKDANGNVIPPPFVIDVFAHASTSDPELGTPSQMVANEVFRSELIKQYPNDTYVDKVFHLVKNTKAEGKNYNTFGITEKKFRVKAATPATGGATPAPARPIAAVAGARK
jgi:hypothetical protein